MIILKIIIATIIVGICFMLGMKKSLMYEKREYILRESINLFKGIENEIRYMLMELPNAIESTRQNMRTSLKDVLGAISLKLLEPNITFEDIYTEIDMLNELKPYDKQILTQGIYSLGSTDVEGQMSLIKSTLNTIEVQLKYAIEEKQKNSKMYKTVGLCAGLMIAIIFI